MSILSGVSDFFGLDIGTTAIRVVQLQGVGPAKTLSRYGYIPVTVKSTQSNSSADQQKLKEALIDLLSQVKINTKNVVVGLPTNKVFTTIADFERIAPSELAKSITYQAESLIPTPIADSTLDWAIVGDSPVDANKIELLLSSVANDYVESRLDMLESIGLNVIAFEPDSMAMSRALLDPNATSPQMILKIGNLSTDLVICIAGVPRLIRSIPTGLDAFIKAATQNLNVDVEQATQFINKFGLSKDKLEGQVYQAIIGVVDVLVGEVEKSVSFFLKRYGENANLERVVVTGAASTLPELPLYLANRLAISVEIGNPWRNITFEPGRQNELLALSNHFSVAAGLAERVE